MRPKRRQMRCDTGLVVGAAAPVESAVAFGRLERRRRPLGGIAFGLHVVVGVQQHGRRSRRRRMPGDDGGRTALADDLHVIKTGLRQQIRRRLGRCDAPGRGGPGRPTPTRCGPGPPDRRRTDGSTSRTRSTRSLMVSRLAVRTRRRAVPTASRLRGWPPRPRCRLRGSATHGSSRPPDAWRCRRSTAPAAVPTCR